MCSIYEATRLPWVERWARGLLDFVLWMQEPDGSWLNFVYDWDSDKNREGITSRPGQNFWLARAVVGVGHAAAALGDERAQAAFVQGMTRAAAEEAPPDIRSLHLLAALRAADAGDRDVIPWIRAWADELVECRDGVVLKNSAYEVGPPAPLGAHPGGGPRDRGRGPAGLDADLGGDRERRGGRAPGDRARVRRCAVDGVRGVLVHHRCRPAVRRDGRATGGPTPPPMRGRGSTAATWRRPPPTIVERGRVADGIDEDRVSDNSGAESNISGAEALLDRAIAIARAMPDPFLA